MRTALLVVVLLAAVVFIGYGRWPGAATPGAEARPGDAPAGSIGGIDASKARERGAEVGEKAAEIATSIQETAAEAGITSKIKAKMALDDYVRALNINVTTQGSTVTLTGKAGSNVERDRAVVLARETEGVSQVVDRIQVSN